MSSESEEECCNSGCNNCVLDIRPRGLLTPRKTNLANGINLFNGTYRNYKITRINELTANVLKIKFEFIADKTDIVGNVFIHLIPTHHLMLRIKSDNSINEITPKHDKEMIENYVSRPYTPFQYIQDEFSFEILVKLIPNGVMSNYMEKIKIGDITEWKGAYGNFNWSAIAPNLPNKSLICVSQGVAIAPIFHLASSILENENDETRINFIGCYRRMDDILLRNELNKCRQYWNFKSSVYLSQERCTECKTKRTINCSCIKSKLFYGETVCNYRLDVQELLDFYDSLSSSNIITLVCGTDSLFKIVQDAIERNDVKLKEYFFRIE